MTEELPCRTAEDIVLPLPSAEELPKLCTKAKRSKPPKLPSGTHWGNSKVGSYTTFDSPDGIIVTWNTVDGPERSFSFEALELDPTYELYRLELGWMIANMLRVEAVRMLNTIPGPNEAMAEANRYYREEERWRCWALWGPNPPQKKPG